MISIVPARHIAAAPAPPVSAAASAGSPAAAAPPIFLRPCPPGFHFARLIGAPEQSVPGYDRPIREFQFDLRGSGISYNTGDHAGILPRNDPARVQAFLEWFGLTGTTLIAVTPTRMPVSESPLPSTLTITELLEQYLDIAAPPTRKLARELSLFAIDPVEKTRLQTLADPDKKESGFETLVKNVSIDEFLRRFPNTMAAVPLDQLVSMIPFIKPRYYSIASSSLARPTQLELVVVRFNWQTPAKTNRVGLCTGYLFSHDPATLSPERSILVPMHVHSGILNPLSDLTVPVIMFGLGVGIAPFRAFLQHRAAQLDAARSSATPVTPALCDLWFACRHVKKDFVYRDYFESLKPSGVLTNVYSVFSHDQKEFRTVVTLMDEHPEWIWNSLRLENVHCFYCGPALGIPEMILAAMQRACERAGGLSPQQAADRKSVV